MSVRRIYVEKKPEYAVRAGELFEDIKTYLGISGIERVRVLVRYDIENIEDGTYEKARGTIFSEPPLDLLYEETFPPRGRRFGLFRRVSAGTVRPARGLRGAVRPSD